MLMRTSFLCALLLLMGSVGCSRKAVTVGDIAGTWVMTKESKATLPVDLRNGRGKLSLRSNGEFVAEELPGELLYSPPGVNNTAPASGAGTWKLEEADGSTALQLSFTAITSPNGHTVPYGSLIFIDNDWSETGLYFFLGDPDQGGRIEFAKVK
jgi:hypothetical protein